MSLRVDLTNRTIHGAIVELIDFQRSQPVASGLVGRLRAELGTRVHQDYRQSKQKVSGFESETGVELRRTIAGFRLHLRGRIDGLTQTKNSLLLEEVKSVVVGGWDLSHAREGFFPDWELQLRLYALALHQVYPTKNMQANLLLISLTDQSRKSIPIAVNHPITEKLLEEITILVIEQAQEEHRQAQTRKALAKQITFPYPEKRQHQAELIDLFAQGLADKRSVLAMAPTGIGKTVAALMAGLRFALDHNAILAFLTAKTTQQELVGNTFLDIHRTSAWPLTAVHCLILRAKEKMCPTGHMLCHPQICPLLEQFQARNDSQVTKQVLASGALIDPEVVLGIAESHRLCPFHLSLALVEQVSVVVCDYNYVYDPGITLMDIVDSPKRPFVAIVDEAHNLFDRARGYYSPAIAKRQLVELGAQIKSGAFLAQSDQTSQLQLEGVVSTISGPALFTEIVDLLVQTQAAIADERKQSEEGLPQAPEQLVCQPDGPRWQHIGRRACELLVPYILYNRTHQLFHDNDPLLKTLTQLMRLKEVMSEPCREIVPYTSGPLAQEGLGFGNLCVNPADRLAQQHKRALGTLAMSATLTPLGYYADVLGFDSETIKTSAPSPFPKENLGVWVVGHIDTTFRKRDEYIEDIATVIQTTVAAKPGRYVAFFPSFKFLSQVHTALSKRPQQAQIILQLPGLAEASRRLMLNQFRKAKGPTLLMAVMGGIFAEGVDLPGEELIGAIVVSPGLPQVGFERSVMQHYFQEEYEQGFAYAMLYPGLQRVIQSAGRVIRTPQDKGVIVLVGRRFAQPELAHSLPEHWYRYSPEELLTSDLTQSLQAFWSHKNQAV